MRRGTTVVWRSRGTGPASSGVAVRPAGNLTLRAGARLLWSAATAGSHATRFVADEQGDARAAVDRRHGVDEPAGNRCRAGTAPVAGSTSTSARSSPRLCNGAKQVLTTPITSGASAFGDGTPTGTWRLQAKIRNTTLYPAAGGAYSVHYWMPYDGAYGMHDSSWQKFPYGSAKYRTQGSHGCVHFPRAAIGLDVRVGADRDDRPHPRLSDGESERPA